LSAQLLTAQTAFLEKKVTVHGSLNAKNSHRGIACSLKKVRGATPFSLIEKASAFSADAASGDTGRDCRDQNPVMRTYVCGVGSVQ